MNSEAMHSYSLEPLDAGQRPVLGRSRRNRVLSQTQKAVEPDAKSPEKPAVGHHLLWRGGGLDKRSASGRGDTRSGEHAVGGAEAG